MNCLANATCTSDTQCGRLGDIVENDRLRYLKAANRVINPFTGDDKVEYLKVLTTNQRQGETVVSARIVTKVEDL